MRGALVVVAAAILGVSGAQAAGVGNMTNHGGSLLASPKVHVILWLPSGRHLDPAGDTTVEARLQSTVENLSGTHYLGVLTQYGATNAVSWGGLWVDTTAYPHAGTSGDPLNISDYADSVQRAMTANGWQPGLDQLYLVFTASQTETCGLATAYGGGRDPAHFYTPNDCTFPDASGDQCAGHSSFTQGGEPVAFAAIPSPAAGACTPPAGSSFDPNNDVPLDEALLNETMFISAMTVDPLGTAWYTGNPQTGEIACFDGLHVADLRLGGKSVPIFPLWSNATRSCASGYPALAVTLTPRAKTVRVHRSQTVTVRTVKGARVVLEIDYPSGGYSVRNGSASSGVYRYTWKVPKARGRVKLIASVSTSDGGTGSARGKFTIH